MAVRGAAKTFFFKLHTDTLPVLTWEERRGLFLPWGSGCFLCKKPENVEHVFLDCWDAVFFWDVLQRTIKKDLPLTAEGIRYLSVNTDSIPYDLLFLLGLHAIWRSRMDVRHNSVDARSVNSYFVEDVCSLRDVVNNDDCDHEFLCLLNELSVMKVHQHFSAN